MKVVSRFIVRLVLVQVERDIVVANMTLYVNVL